MTRLSSPVTLSLVILSGVEGGVEGSLLTVIAGKFFRLSSVEGFPVLSRQERGFSHPYKTITA